MAVSAKETGLGDRAIYGVRQLQPEDWAFAIRVAKDLKAKGAKVWMDKLDIRPGQRWEQEVETALHGCSRMLVILSPASVGSSNVLAEAAFAIDEGKEVIPVLYLECKIPFRLRPFQYADFRTSYDEGLQELLATLGSDRAAETAAEQARLEEKRKRAAAEKARLGQEERERSVRTFGTVIQASTRALKAHSAPFLIALIIGAILVGWLSYRAFFGSRTAPGANARPLLSNSSSRNLDQVRSSLVNLLTAELASAKAQKPEALWTVAQMAVAMERLAPFDQASVIMYLQKAKNQDCSCWKEYGREAPTGVSCWVLLALFVHAGDAWNF